MTISLLSNSRTRDINKKIDNKKKQGILLIRVHGHKEKIDGYN